MQNKNSLLITIPLIVATFFVGHLLGSRKNNNLIKPPISLQDESMSENFCDRNSSPFLSFVSPKGTEFYYQNSALLIEWRSCNVPSETHLSLKLNSVDDPSRIMDLACEDKSWGQPCFVKHGARLIGLSELFKNGISSGIYTVQIASLGDLGISITSNPFFISSDTITSTDPTEKGDDINGRHLGYIKSISYSKSTSSLTIDYIEWVSPCPENKECPNGYMINDTNHHLRTFPISDSVKISLQTYAHQNSGIDKGNFQWGLSVDLKTFSSLFNNPTQLYSPKDISFHITLSGGKVIEITEQYQP